MCNCVLKRNQCWNFQTVYGGQEQSRKRVVVPARQASQQGGIVSLESILGLLKSLKIWALVGFARLICIFSILFTVAAHLINVIARMSTKWAEKKSNQIRLL
jgi:hypothetical protein